MNISMAELAQEIDVPEVAEISSQEAAENFMPASVIGLSDGDLVALHAPYSGRLADLYGEQSFAEGKVAQAVRETAIKNGLRPSQIYDFQSFAAEYFTGPGSVFAGPQPVSNIRLHPEALQIDGKVLSLREPPRMVIDYAACLTSRSYLHDQVNFLKAGHLPFAYTPITRLHFVNHVLQRTYDAVYGPGTNRAFIDRHWYIGRENGVAETTGEIIDAQRSHGAPAEVADIIICAGTQHTTAEELKPGIERARTLLKEGGMLIVRSLAKPAEAELGTEEVAGWAYDTGFEEANTQEFSGDITQVGALFTSGHFGNRVIKTAVLTK